MFKLSLSVSKTQPKNKTAGLTVTEFTSKELDIDHDTDLRDLFTTRVYSTNYWKNGKCNKTNYLGMYGLSMDIDKDIPLEKAKELFKDYNYVIHTSTSHRADLPNKGGVHDRFRVILPCDPDNYSKYTDSKRAEALYSALIKKYPFIDAACAELARKYFPFLNAQYPQLFECYINDTGTYFSVDDAEVDAEISATPSTPVKRTRATLDLTDSNRKYIHRDDEVLLPDKVTKMKIEDFVVGGPIFCPFCDDINSQSASGLLTFTSEGYPMIHCSHCTDEHKKTGNPQNGKYHLPVNEQYNNIFYIDNRIYTVRELANNITLGLIPDSYLFGLSNDRQKALKHWLAHNRYFTAESFTVERKVNGYIEDLQWKLNSKQGILDINIPPIATEIEDNDFINNWLDEIFQMHAEWIKDWLSLFCYTNFIPMPILIINGPRGCGKSTFAEFVGNLFSGVSMDWKGEKETFTDHNEKRLLIMDEANVDKKEQYTLFKSITGQQKLSVNKKYKAPYQVRNNLCLILLTNEATPMFLVEQERPKTPEDNQFFMYFMERTRTTLNSNIKNLLKARAGHYVRTELRARAQRIFDSGKMQECRYAIPTPMTELLMEQFDNARTSLDYDCDLLHKYCVNGFVVKDRIGAHIRNVGPYDIINSAELQELIDLAKLPHSNIKSFLERMRLLGYLQGKVTKKNGLEAWYVNPAGRK
jgi:hypothetical protein